jgi:hypothetical protein
LNDKTKQLLEKFNIIFSDFDTKFTKYPQYEFVNRFPCWGEGSVGMFGYLILWPHNTLEKLNDEYMVSEFVNDVFIIGSDGSDLAFGVNSIGEFIEMPFIGMSDESKKVIAKTFDEFIMYISRMNL